MDVKQLQRQYHDLTWQLCREGYVDEYFRQLQQFEGQSPGFLFDTMTTYFGNAENTLAEIRELLGNESVDYDQITNHLIKLKGGTLSVGASKLNNVCATFQNYCSNKSKEGCSVCLQEFEQQMFLLRDKLTSLFQLAHLIVTHGGKL